MLDDCGSRALEDGRGLLKGLSENQTAISIAREANGNLRKNVNRSIIKYGTC